MIDITNQGSRVEWDTRDYESVSVSTPMEIDSAVVELKQLANGVAVPYSPAKTISSANSAIIGASVDGIDAVILEVTTADSSGQEIVVNLDGKEIS